MIGYRSSDVVISLWGGISMLNFLLPAGKVEIVITSWFEDNGMMPMPNTTSVPPTVSCHVYNEVFVDDNNIADCVE